MGRAGARIMDGMKGSPVTPVLSRPEGRSSLSDVVDLYKEGIDRSLLHESLKRTPEERLRALMELQKLAEELRRAGQRL